MLALGIALAFPASAPAQDDSSRVVIAVLPYGTTAEELGAVHDRVPCGVSVGIMDSIPALLDAVGGYLDEGYVRIKLKIEPGWDIEPVRSVRERFGDEVLLQVAIYCGVPAGMDSFRIAKEALAAMDEQKA